LQKLAEKGKLGGPHLLEAAMDPLTITRSIRIDAASEAVWASVGAADGLAGWIGESVDLDVAVGAAGSVVDHDGTRRRLVVTEVAEGERVGFVWWDDDRPDDVSTVVICLDDEGDGARVTVTETLDPVNAGAAGGLGGRASSLAGAEVGDLVEVADRWEGRLGRLLGLASLAAAGVVG